MRWPAFVVPAPRGNKLKVRAERWTVLLLDFLELLITVDVEAAEAAHRVLAGFVTGKGVQAATGEAKTSQVMKALVAHAARGEA